MVAHFCSHPPPAAVATSGAKELILPEVQRQGRGQEAPEAFQLSGYSGMQPVLKHSSPRAKHIDSEAITADRNMRKRGRKNGDEESRANTFCTTL